MKTQYTLAAALALITLSAQAQTKEEVIQDALKNGAIIVTCSNGLCRNTQSGEVVGEGQGGPYLVYPDDPKYREKEQRTAQQLAKVEK
jgi:hypothetical protein